MDKNKLSSIVFYFSILIFIIAFNFSDNPAGGWYQQFLPNLNGRPISDITFIDSLTGWVVTPFTQQDDTVYILKTTNGGDNWFLNYTGIGQFVGMKRIFFLNEFIGYACGNGLNNSTQNNFAKTTTGGSNWFNINPPDPSLVYDDMNILNEDTIWLAASSTLTGGVFRTTNGGTSWQLQYSGGITNPDRIYFANGNFGFMSRTSGQLYRTTNSGVNWTQVPGGPFTDIYFADSLTGWKAYGQTGIIRKTTNGGLNWMDQSLPQGGYILISKIIRFSNVNKDTLWGVGGFVGYPNNTGRGIVYRTTNGGINWLYQIPDTTIDIGQYLFTDFQSKNEDGVITKIQEFILKLVETQHSIPE